MIGILDYGMGNLHSVYNALVFLDGDVEFVTVPKDLFKVDSLIIPGVGSFRMAMENLNSMNIVEPIKEFSESGKPILGICLGMQLFATIGYEPHKTSGLGLIGGKVVKLNCGMRLPHVGWNGIKLENEHQLFKGVKITADFYFVHTYHFVPTSENFILTLTDYGLEFVSAIQNKNVIGFQFHPEKSQKQGLIILQNFIELSDA